MPATAIATELNEHSTPEEVASYVEQIAEEKRQEYEKQRAEGGSTKKGDARITSDHADNEHKEYKETPAEKPSGSSADGGETSSTDGGEDTGDESWLDDDLKAEVVAAYGIDEKDLAEFSSREELERALKFFDRSALEAGRRVMADAEKAKPQTRDERGRYAKASEPESEPESEPKSRPKEGQLEITLDKEIYGEELVDGFTQMCDHYAQMRDHYESRIADLEARFSEADYRQKEQQFDSAVDSLGCADLFGKTGNETPKELEQRQELFFAVEAQQIGQERLGRPMNLNQYPSLVSRVARMVFAEYFDKKNLKAQTRKITRQSNGRQGGGAIRPQDSREDPRDEFDRLYKEMSGHS